MKRPHLDQWQRIAIRMNSHVGAHYMLNLRLKQFFKILLSSASQLPITCAFKRIVS